MDNQQEIKSQQSQKSTNLIPKMVKRVYQQDKAVLSQYYSDRSIYNTHQKSGLAEESKMGKQTKSEKSNNIVDELQEVVSFLKEVKQEQYDSEIINFQQDLQIDFSYCIFSLPQKATRLILSCLMDNFHNITLVNAKWYVAIYDILNEWLEELDNKFIKSQLSVLTFKNSFLSFKPFQISKKKKGFRVDRCIIAEVLPETEGREINFGFRYKWMKPQSTFFRYEFKYDVVSPKQPRKLWLSKEEARHNYDDEESIPVTAQIVQVCGGDSIQISINFFNLFGLIDLDSIHWDHPLIDVTPKSKAIFSPLKKSRRQNHRIYHLEEQYSDWILYDYYPNKQNKFKCDDMRPQLVLKEARCAGIDTVVNRMIFEADQAGLVGGSLFGIPIQVISQKEELTVEIKKFGLMADQLLPIQIRSGDQITFYLTRGD